MGMRDHKQEAEDKGRSGREPRKSCQKELRSIAHQNHWTSHCRPYRKFGTAEVSCKPCISLDMIGLLDSRGVSSLLVLYSVCLNRLLNACCMLACLNDRSELGST